MVDPTPEANIYIQYEKEYGTAALEQMKRYMSGKDDYDITDCELSLGGTQTHPHRLLHYLHQIETVSLTYRVNYDTEDVSGLCMTFFKLSSSDINWCPVNTYYFDQIVQNRFF